MTSLVAGQSQAECLESSQLGESTSLNPTKATQPGASGCGQSLQPSGGGAGQATTEQSNRPVLFSWVMPLGVLLALPVPVKVCRTVDRVCPGGG